MTVPGGKIAAAPAARSASKSCGGITPPTTIMMSARPSVGERVAQLGHQREVAGGERRHADDVHVGLDRLAGDLVGRLEQRADVDVEAEVGERGGDHLLAAVVAVLAHLGDEDARPAALGARRTRRRARAPAATFGDSPTSLRYTPAIVRIAAVWRPKTFSSASLISPTRGPRPGGVDRELEQVLVSPSPRCRRPRPRRGGQRVERGVARRLVALGAQPLELGDLLRRAPRRCRP